MKARTRDIRLVFYTDPKGKQRWRCIAGNGLILARSTLAYATREDAMTDARFLYTQHPPAEIYQDKSGLWRWRCKNSGKIIAVSTESYLAQATCIEASSILLVAIEI